MNSETFPLADRAILVTGGGRGLGKALCRALTEAGAAVVVADIQSDLARQVADELVDRGHRATAETVDVGNDSQVTACVRGMIERYGKIDVLINNAGIDFTLPLTELEVPQWDRVIATNLRGPFLLARQAALQMKARHGGHIINIASTAAKRGWPNASAFHASNWGLLGFSHALHAELRPFGIKVSAVIAGGMRTPFLLDRFPDIEKNLLQDPAVVAATVVHLLTLPPESVVAEVSVLPMGELSWP